MKLLHICFQIAPRRLYYLGLAYKESKNQKNQWSGSYPHSLFEYPMSKETDLFSIHTHVVSLQSVCNGQFLKQTNDPMLEQCFPLNLKFST